MIARRATARAVAILTLVAILLFMLAPGAGYQAHGFPRVQGDAAGEVLEPRHVSAWGLQAEAWRPSMTWWDDPPLHTSLWLAGPLAAGALASLGVAWRTRQRVSRAQRLAPIVVLLALVCGAALAFDDHEAEASTRCEAIVKERLIDGPGAHCDVSEGPAEWLLAPVLIGASSLLWIHSRPVKPPDIPRLDNLADA